jgi:hypothetical protein
LTPTGIEFKRTGRKGTLDLSWEEILGLTAMEPDDREVVRGAHVVALHALQVAGFENIDDYYDDGEESQ